MRCARFQSDAHRAPRLLGVYDNRGSALVESAAYTYDPAGNRLTRTETFPGSKHGQTIQKTAAYTYDDIYQLTQAVVNGSTTDSYSYDAVGNRLTDQFGGTYSYNNSNQLLTYPAYGWTYDSNGNTASRTVSGSTTSYSWDYENRLTSVTLPSGGGTVSFKYDPFGRRVEKISPTSGTTIYAYDGDNIVEELDGSGSATARYTQGLGIDEPMEVQVGHGSYYYSADGLGSVVALTKSNGSAVNTYFGYNTFGGMPAPTETVANPFRFTGREWDSETGLYYYRARYYDPLWGRFLSEDPLRSRSGPNFYNYVHNRPTILRDPTGRFAWGTIGGSITGIAGALGAAGAIKGSCTIVQDSKGNTGLLCCGGVGGGVAEGLDVSAQWTMIVCPGCKTICEMEGGNVQVQIFGGVGAGGNVGGGASVGTNHISIMGSAGPAGAVGGGAVVLGGSCKLVLGGKRCKKCPAGTK
jgi:RHS repeat-associated protein